MKETLINYLEHLILELKDENTQLYKDDLFIEENCDHNSLSIKGMSYPFLTGNKDYNIKFSIYNSKLRNNIIG